MSHFFKSVHFAPDRLCLGMRKTDKFTFFYSKYDTFSNWHPMSFKFREIEFCCGEQFMMYAKARQFGDLDAARRTLETQDPMEHKQIGRAVKNFNKEVWNQRARHTVYVGARERFTQNESAYDLLLSTEGTKLVEASKSDTIWGVGLSENDPRIEDPRQWRGSNWLGETLTMLRDDLIVLPRPQFPVNSHQRHPGPASP